METESTMRQLMTPPRACQLYVCVNVLGFYLGESVMSCMLSDKKKLDPSLLWKLLHTVQVLVSVFSVFFADIPYYANAECWCICI